jgi:hypothetical protein
MNENKWGNLPCTSNARRRVCPSKKGWIAPEQTHHRCELFVFGAPCSKEKERILRLNLDKGAQRPRGPLPPWGGLDILALEKCSR